MCVEEFNSNLQARRRKLKSMAAKLDQSARELSTRQEALDEQEEEQECQQTNLQSVGKACVTLFTAID